MSNYIKTGLWLIYTKRAGDSTEDHLLIKIPGQTTGGDLDKMLREKLGEKFVIVNMVRLS